MKRFHLKAGIVRVLWALLVISLVAAAVYMTVCPPGASQGQSSASFDIDSLPPFGDSPYCIINNNIPFFTDDEIVSDYFASYSPRDGLNRCGPASACLHWSQLHSEERGDIGMVRPSGWHTVRYDGLIEDRYLYNRCHLIAFMFTGENANPDNLITGTRYMNKTGMLPFEKEVYDYLNESGNHVMYRVTPVFAGRELVARGVLMEALSAEDSGRGLRFNVFVYNAQPGIEIDYSDGSSRIK